MKIGLVAIAHVVVDATVKVRPETGTVFEQTMSDTYFYVDAPETSIHILREAPRLTLQAEDYNECDKNLGGYCGFLFDSYDERIWRFVKLDLVKRYRNSLELPPMSKTSKKKRDTNVSRKEKTAVQVREPRAVSALVQAGLVITIALSAYFIGDAIAKEDLNQVREKIKLQEDMIRKLEKIVSIDTEGLQSTINQLKLNPETVIYPNRTTNSPFLRYMKAKTTHHDFNPTMNVRKYQRFFADHIQTLALEEAREVEEAVLVLQNNRLPLKSDFLLAVRAKCLAVQKEINSKTRRYCNDLAFYSTRWDTGLTFLGLGFSTKNKKITNSVFSLKLRIPILEEGELSRFRIMNLGRFQSSSVVRHVELPSAAVMTASDIIHPLDTTQCLTLNQCTICPESSIGAYDECLSSVFNGSLASNCVVKDNTAPRPCQSQVEEKFVIVSLDRPRVVHYNVKSGRSFRKLQHVDAFGVVPRTDATGSIFCASSQHFHVAPEIPIPPIAQQIETKYEIAIIKSELISLESRKPTEKKVKDIAIDLGEAQETLQNLRLDLDKSSKMTLKAHNVTKIFGTFKKDVVAQVDEVKEASKSLFNGIYKIFTPIIATIILCLLIFMCWSPLVNCVTNTNNNRRNQIGESIPCTTGLRSSSSS